MMQYKKKRTMLECDGKMDCGCGSNLFEIELVGWSLFAICSICGEKAEVQEVAKEHNAEPKEKLK